MNYSALSDAIQAYTENTDATFVAEIPVFVQQAEQRIYNTIQFPSLRKNVTGATTDNNKYLACPSDFLSVYSLALVDALGNYEYLLNKDVNFIRQAYPNPSDKAIPKYYALFGSQSNDANELTFILGPTPDATYVAELHYFYYPPTIVQGVVTTFDLPFTAGSAYVNGVYPNVPLSGGSGTNLTCTIQVVGGAVASITIDNGGAFYAANDALSVSNTYLGNSGSGFAITVDTVSNASGTSWLGDNFDPPLLYGALREAILFMKGEQDLVAYYEQKFTEAMQMLKRLGDGLERGDAYRDGQVKLPVKT